MKELTELLQSLSTEVILDEDGNSLCLEKNLPIIKGEIDRFEKNSGIFLIEEMKELLLFSNGLNLFGISIMSLDEMEFFPQTKILSFHNWGNGDFDCISLDSNFAIGSILYMAHNENKLKLVRPSLISWFTDVIAEIKARGTLLHPSDFRNRECDGMYKNIKYNLS